MSSDGGRDRRPSHVSCDDNLCTNLCVSPQLSAYGGSVVYSVSYAVDQREQIAIRVTSEPDLIIEVRLTHTHTGARGSVERV